MRLEGQKPGLQQEAAFSVGVALPEDVVLEPVRREQLWVEAGAD